MHITKVRRTKKKIIVEYTVDGEERVLRAPENPLPAFNEAFDALTPLVCEICHLPAKFGNKLTVLEVKLTDKGNELVTFKASKEIDDSTDAFKFSTPNRLTSHPKEEGKCSPPLKEAQVALITALIDEAAAYVKGDRAQGQIQFPAGEDDPEDGDDGAAEPEAGEKLNFSESAANSTGTPAKKKAAKKKTK
jgi:hypothetical protein